MNHIKTLTNGDISKAADALVARLYAAVTPSMRPLGVYGIPRGGIPATYAVQAAWFREYSRPLEIVDDPALADAFIDDVLDSGATRDRYAKRYPGRPFLPLFKTTEEGCWLVFPWENDEQGSAEDIPRRLLQLIGEDVTRGGLHETPKRFLSAWQTYTSGYRTDPIEMLKTFEDGAERYDELVLVKDIPVYSHCEHHLAPFFGVAHVGYIPNGKVVGLSKLARLVDVFARRLQVQERLTQQIAGTLNDALQPVGVGVVIECRHMCMEARGIRAQGTSTTTSALLGKLRTSDTARAEFLRLIR